MVGREIDITELSWLDAPSSRTSMVDDDAWMAHSLLSAPLNLGLLDPIEVVHRIEQAHRDGEVPIAAAYSRGGSSPKRTTSGDNVISGPRAATEARMPTASFWLMGLSSATRMRRGRRCARVVRR